MPSRTQNRGSSGQNEQRAVAVMSPETAKEKATSIQRSLEGRREQMISLLGGDERLADRFLTVALASIVKSNDLLNADPLSLLNAVRDAAQMGLEPAGPLGEGVIVAYETPRGSGRYIAQFQPMVRGIRKLAMQSPGVTVVNVGIRHEKDEFEYREGSDPFVRHVPWIDDDDPGAVMGAYAYARLNGEVVALYMNLAEIRKRRNVARSQTIWNAWEEEMMKKTVLRRFVHEKIVMTPRLGLALSVDEADLDRPVITTPARPQIAAPGSRTRSRYVEDAAETPENGSGAAEGSQADSEAGEATEGVTRAVCGAQGMKEGETCVLLPHETDVPHEAESGAVWG